MQIKAEEISQIIKDQIGAYETSVDLNETGTVISVGDGIARVYGVQNCMAMELLEFPGGIMGLALNLEADNVGCAVLGNVPVLKKVTLSSEPEKLLRFRLDRKWKVVLLTVSVFRLMVRDRLIPNLPQRSRYWHLVLLPEKVFMSPVIPVQKRLMP